MARFGSLGAQYFDDAGDPLIDGFIYFYESGTTTLKNTYADVNLSIPNQNPVPLTASGRQPNIFFDGTAKAILTKSDTTQVEVRDPVGETSSSFGDPWLVERTYSTSQVVRGSNNQYFSSKIDGNNGNNPVTTSGFWDTLFSLEWNSLYTYPLGSNTQGSDGKLYVSLVSGNIGNDPVNSPASWASLQPTGEILLASVDAVAVTSVEFDGYYTPEYKNYVIKFDELIVTPSGGGSNHIYLDVMQTGAPVTRASYYYSHHSETTSTSTHSGLSNSTLPYIFDDGTLGVATNKAQGEIKIYDPLATDNAKYFTGHAVSAALNTCRSSMMHNSVSASSGVRISSEGSAVNTFTGKFRLYGVINS